MANNVDKNDLFDKFKLEYIEARNNVGFHLLKLALIVLEANKKLNNRSWKRWLKDPKVNLKNTQAKKLIAVALKCRNNGQLTDLLNKEGIEKTYLVCQIKNDAIRNNVSEQIIDVDFTVKQTKEVIQKVEKENIPTQKAIEAVKNQTKKTVIRSERKTISIEIYEKLKNAYELVLAEKQELEKLVNKLKVQEPCQCSDNTCKTNEKDLEDSDIESIKTEIQPLEKPVKTDLEDGIVSSERHSITCKGYELPLPEHLKNITNITSTTLNYEAIKLAKDKFALDLS